MLHLSKKDWETRWHAFSKWRKTDRAKRPLLILTVIIVVLLISLFISEQSLLKRYRRLESVLVKDRHGEIISILPNSKGEYSNYVDNLPEQFKRLLIKKFDNGVRSFGGLHFHKDRVKFILTNPFYVGLFKYGGEIHEGRHTPIIEKRLFDKVQKVIA